VRSWLFHGWEFLDGLKKWKLDKVAIGYSWRGNLEEVNS